MSSSVFVASLFLITSFVETHQIENSGINLTILSPHPGDPWQQEIEVRVSLELNQGIDADLVRNDVSSYEVCFSGGQSVICNSLINGNEIPLISLDNPIDGLSEVSAWIQFHYGNINIDDSNQMNCGGYVVIDKKNDVKNSRKNDIIGQVSQVFLWKDSEDAAVGLQHLIEEYTKTKQQNQINLLKLHLKFIMCNKKTYIQNGYGYYQQNVGFGTYGLKSSIFHFWGYKNITITFGRFCSIGARTEFFLDGNHRTSAVSTYPFIERAEELGFHHQKVQDNEEVEEENDKLSKRQNGNNGNIVIGHDVWIGEDATVLSGVEIGHGAVIGTKSVVTKSIPPYSIYAGNPAKFIKYRFDNETIRQLLEISWWNWDYTTIQETMSELLSGDIGDFIAKSSLLKHSADHSHCRN